MGACKKDDDAYEKKFRCKVNGQKWSPYSSDFKFNPVDVHSIISTTGKRTLLVAGYNSQNNIGSVGFFIPDITKAKNYPLKLTPTSHGFLKISSTNYETDNENTGVVTIHSFDTINQKVSGAFSFKLRSGGNNIVSVTEGHFEVTYKSY